MTEQYEYVRGYRDGRADEHDHHLLNGPTQPVPTIKLAEGDNEKSARIAVLTGALGRAEKAQPRDFKSVNLFEHALTDVLIDGVQERTMAALDAARAYWP
jgi:hypothetical protein